MRADDAAAGGRGVAHGFRREHGALECVRRRYVRLRRAFAHANADAGGGEIDAARHDQACADQLVDRLAAGEENIRGLAGGEMLEQSAGRRVERANGGITSSVTVLSAVEMKASIAAALAVPAAASIAMAMANMRMTLPVSFAAIPGVEQIGEPVIAETGDLMNARQADQRGEPAIAGGRAPNGDRAIGADMEAAIGIDAVQSAAHIR